MLGDKNRKVAEVYRHYLKIVCEVLLFTATQKIAQRESGSVVLFIEMSILILRISPIVQIVVTSWGFLPW